MNKTFFKETGKTIISAIKKHSPAILIGVGIAGMAATVVLAVKATPKATEHLKEKQDALIKKEFDKLTEELGHEPEEFPGIPNLSIRDKFAATWKDYIPAAITFTASSASILFAHGILTSKMSAISTAYKMSEVAFKEYEDKVKETIGEKKNNAIKDEMAIDKVRKCPLSPNDIIETGHGKTICFDPFTGRYFRTDISNVERAYMKLTTILNTDDCVDLNTFYDLLDIDRVKLGDTVGWSIGKVLRKTGGRELKPKFTSTLYDDDTPVLVCGFELPPQYDWNWD